MKHLPFIDTERLILRPITLEDAFEFFEMDSQSKVHHYLNNKPMESVDEAINTINDLHVQYYKYGIGRMAIIEKETFKFIGWIGFKYIPKEEEINNKNEYLDFGYRLREEAWRKGYATEAAKACIDYYNKNLQQYEVNAVTHLENGASKKILEKVGFEATEKFHFKIFNTECYWYEFKNGK